MGSVGGTSHTAASASSVATGIRTSLPRREAGNGPTPLRVLRLCVAPIVIAAFVTVALVGCREPGSDSPDEQIRAAIVEAEGAAERREIGVLKNLVAEGYKDSRGYDKRSIVRLVQGYLLRHRNIYLLTKVDTVVLPNPDSAFTSLLLAMAGRRIETPEDLWNVRAELLQVELEWKHTDGEWRVVGADWRRATVDDFLPG